MSTNMTDIRSVPLAALTLSQTPAQIERRAHFDKAKLGELVESIKGEGVLQPIVVRPFRDEMVKGDTYEVVAGERRVLASRLAGLEEITATVRDLSDLQVAKIQLIENLQREEVHPIAEAEGYEELLKRHDYTVDHIAADTGKSKAYVYARLKLLALDPASRDAFYRGTLSASVALLIARIPTAVLQRQACGEVVSPKYRDEPMSYREAAEHIQEHYMLRLADAAFPTGDAELFPRAGACGTCPKRTGNQPELFADVKGADVCTDPGCFKQKREAWSKRQLAAAKVSGQKIIAGAEAKRIAPYGENSGLAAGYARLDDKCYDDPKGRTYKQLLGKEIKPELLQMPKSGDVIEVIPKNLVTKALKDQGVRTAAAPTSNPQTAAEKKAKKERVFRVRLYEQIREKAPDKLGRVELEQIAVTFFNRLEHEMQKAVLGIWYVEPEKAKHHMGVNTENTAAKFIPTLTDAKLSHFLLDCSFVNELRTSSWSNEPPAKLLAAAKRLKVDPEKIRKELAAAEKAKSPAPAKASKKKATKGKAA